MRDNERIFRQYFTKFGISDPRTFIAANKIREELELEMLHNDFELESSIWKLTIYKIIQEFRNQLKSHTVGDSHRNTPRRDSRDNKESKESNELLMKFRIFLIDSFGYYLQLLLKLNSKFNCLDYYLINSIPLTTIAIDSTIDTTIDAEKRDNNSKREVELVIYKIMIYLGDIARYKEIYSNKKIKQWQVPIRFYKLAQYLQPDNGNPFNQLAVISTYQSNELAAVSMYFRSLVVLQPFNTALDNIQLLLEKAKNTINTKNPPSLDSRFAALIGRLFSPSVEYFIANSSASEFTADSRLFMDEFRMFITADFNNRNSKILDLLSVVLSVLYLLHKQPLARIDSSIIDHSIIVMLLIDLCTVIMEHIEKLNYDKHDSIENYGMVSCKINDQWENYLPIINLVLKIASSELLFNFYHLNLSKFWSLLAAAITTVSKNQLDLYAGLLPSAAIIFPEDAQFFGFLPLKSRITSISCNQISLQEAGLDEIEEIRTRCHQIVQHTIELCNLDCPKIYLHETKLGIRFSTNPPKISVFQTNINNSNNQGLADVANIWNINNNINQNEIPISTNNNSLFGNRFDSEFHIVDDVASIVSTQRANVGNRLLPSSLGISLSPPQLSFLGSGSGNINNIGNAHNPKANTTTSINTDSESPVKRVNSPLFNRLSSHQQNMVSPQWDRFSIFQNTRKSERESSAVIDWLGAVSSDQ